MSRKFEVQQRWEVRITQRLAGELSEAAWDDMPLAFKRVEEALRQHANAAFVTVGGSAGARHKGITAVVLFAEPLSPGAAIDKALEMFLQACAETGFATDVVVEIVAEPGGVDPRSLL